MKAIAEKTENSSTVCYMTRATLIRLFEHRIYIEVQVQMCLIILVLSSYFLQ